MSLSSLEYLEDGGTLSFSRRSVGALGATTRAVNAIGTLWMFAIMFMILADVIGRNIFNLPVVGVPELVSYSIAGSVFLQMANTLFVGRFVRAEPLINALDVKWPGAGAIYHVVFNAAGVVIFALIISEMYPLFMEQISDVEKHQYGNPGLFVIPDWPLSLMILIGSSLTALVYAVFLVRGLFNFVRHFSESLKTKNTPFGWWAVGLMALLFIGVYIITQQDLSKVEIGLISLLGMIAMIFLGIHIGIALILLSFIGVWIMLTPEIGLNVIKNASSQYLKNHFFGVVPLFVLMGLVVKETGIAADTFAVAKWILRPVKGGLGVATVAANAIFAAITGSSIASAAVFTKIATPELMKHGYTPRFSVGVVAGSSVLGMLIPPSLLLIVYGFVAERSVGELFLAALVPGLILAVAMGIAIIGMAHFWPNFVGAPDTRADKDVETFNSALVKVLPIFILVVAVLGGIYSGLVTPLEAGAVGAMGAILIALVMRRLDIKTFWNVLVDTGHVTVAILFLILAANIYNRMLALSGLPQEMGDLIGQAGLGFFGFMMLYLGLVIFLGMFLESISLMLIVLPLVLPIVAAFGGDYIWFGIVTVIAVEMGLLTPPLGIACYVVRSTTDDPRITLIRIFSGAIPFVIIMLAVTILLIAVPELSLIFVND